MARFMWATGIESSEPTIALPDGRGSTRRHRVDQFAKCGHYDRWRDDFALVRHDLGLCCLRYGPPYHSTHRGPGRYDWAFADDTFAELRQLGITPIVDLCHFGVPDWIGDFQNPDWPGLFADYAAAFAARFAWCRLYTPVNEIIIAATFSALYGWWNERLSSDRAFVTAVKHLCRANVLAMEAILAARPDAVFVQSESSEHYVPIQSSCLEHTRFLNERRFLALDLTYGNSVEASVYAYLLDNGMTADEFRWFRRQHLKPRCVMGNDYYLTNEHFVHPDGGLSGSGEMFGYAFITRQYYDRYHLPVFHTETNVADPALAPAWLRRQAMNVYQLKRDGIPVMGFTWYSLTDQVDWDTQLREDNGRVIPCGLYDLARRPRPAAAMYREIIDEWGGYMDTESVFPLSGP